MEKTAERVCACLCPLSNFTPDHSEGRNRTEPSVVHVYIDVVSDYVGAGKSKEGWFYNSAAK